MYTSTFTNIFYGTFPAATSLDKDKAKEGDTADKDKKSSSSGSEDSRPRTSMKLVTLLPDEKVLGIHLIGDHRVFGYVILLC